MDVIAFDITDLIAQNPSIQRQIATYQMLLTPDKIKDWDIKSGDQINVVGYPAGIRHRTTNFPIVRSGIISSMIGEQLENDFRSTEGTPRKRILRGFLVDGAIIPGSSGSPVVLPSISFRNVGERLQIQNFPLLLLGIIAETRIASIVTPKTDYLSFAGLGLAFDAQTIIETIELLLILTFSTNFHLLLRNSCVNDLTKVSKLTRRLFTITSSHNSQIIISSKIIPVKLRSQIGTNMSLIPSGPIFANNAFNGITEFMKNNGLSEIHMNNTLKTNFAFG